MHTRRSCLLAIAALAITAPWPAAAARVLVEGQTFDNAVQAAGDGLLLNGTGVRAVAWFKAYAAALYLRSRASTAEQAQAMGGAKRLQLRMLQDVPAAEFTKAVHKGVSRNSTADELNALQARLDEFERHVSAIGRVRKGDVVDLDQEPGRGLVLRVNGTLRGAPIAGDDFFDAVLRSFVGDQPYDDQLKAGLLGRPH